MGITLSYRLLGFKLRLIHYIYVSIYASNGLGRSHPLIIALTRSPVTAGEANVLNHLDKTSKGNENLACFMTLGRLLADVVHNLVP